MRRSIWREGAEYNSGYPANDEQRNILKQLYPHSLLAPVDIPAVWNGSLRNTQQDDRVLMNYLVNGEEENL